MRHAHAASTKVSDNIETPLRLNAIRISGANSTRSSFLASVIAPYLSPLPAASYMSSRPVDTPSQTLGSLLKTTRDVTATLRAFDIFKDIDAGLEASPSVLAEAEDVDIVLRVKEAPKYFLRTATDIGDGEGSAVSIRPQPWQFARDTRLLPPFRLGQPEYATRLVEPRLSRATYPSARARRMLFRYALQERSVYVHEIDDCIAAAP